MQLSAKLKLQRYFEWRILHVHKILINSVIYIHRVNKAQKAQGRKTQPAGKFIYFPCYFHFDIKIKLGYRFSLL